MDVALVHSVSRAQSLLFLRIFLNFKMLMVKIVNKNKKNTSYRVSISAFTREREEKIARAFLPIDVVNNRILCYYLGYHMSSKL